MTTTNRLAAVFIAVTLLSGLAPTRLLAGDAMNQKRTRLTFNKPVQVPGMTLPAGTYVFRIANPDAPKMWQVYDAGERHLLAQFFFVTTRERSLSERKTGHGKPVIRFYETAQGVAPAVRVMYYPMDLAGHYFVYPTEQAREIQAAAHQPVLTVGDAATTAAVARTMGAEPPTAGSASK